MSTLSERESEAGRLNDETNIFLKTFHRLVRWVVGGLVG